MEARKRGREEYLQQQVEQKAKQEAENKAKKGAESTPKNIKIGGFELTPEQWQTLNGRRFRKILNPM